MSLNRIQECIRQLDDPQQGLYARTDRQKWEQLKLFVGMLAAAPQPPAALPGGAPWPTDQQILNAAEEAGLLPNTIHGWMPALKRYHIFLDAAMAAKGRTDGGEPA